MFVLMTADIPIIEVLYIFLSFLLFVAINDALHESREHSVEDFELLGLKNKEHSGSQQNEKYHITVSERGVSSIFGFCPYGLVDVFPTEDRKATLQKRSICIWLTVKVWEYFSRLISQMLK